MNDRVPATGGAGYERAVRAVDTAVRASACPVCDADRAHARFEVEGMASPIVVCDRCGLGRFDPMPDPEAVRGFYPDEYYGEPGTKFQPLIERLVRIVGERHISFLSRGLAPGARVLDVGCGRGVVLGPLADRGFEVHGVEISAEATRGADPRAEIRIAPRLADAGYEDQFFDTVMIWHVLEHLHDPRGVLEEVHRILRPGGRLIVAVPNLSSLQARWTGAAWFHLDLPRHLYHFSLRSLEELIERTGFEVDSAHHFSLRQNPFGWIQSFLNRMASLPRNGLYSLLHRRSSAQRAPFDAATRRRLWLGLLVLAPLSLVLMVFETLARSGATVHVVAQRGPQGSR
jgi:2-polyprenyl-3-methyl-5-hydroxy-6-metoxy-1,4-benzoquinol methylase